MYMVTEIWYPANKGSEVGKVYLESMKKFPDDKSIEKPIIRAAFWAEKKGIHAISISSIKPGKVKESMDLATNRNLMLSSVEGYVFITRIAYDLVEGMQFVGLTAPAE
ncbi:MAG: hypothetical protein ACTSPS_07470 [Promethearchaeota archaeon]